MVWAANLTVSTVFMQVRRLTATHCHPYVQSPGAGIWSPNSATQHWADGARRESETHMGPYPARRQTRSTPEVVKDPTMSRGFFRHLDSTDG